MPELMRLEAGSAESRDRVELVLSRCGPVYLAALAGGRRHVGAVARRRGGASALLVFPGHREGPLASAAASALGPLLDGDLYVTAGIHYDDATKEEIARIVANAEGLIGEMAGRLGRAEP